MAHQVFVSYATEDADTASRVCALLEADGFPCWIAPRDVKAGTDYAAAILGAIRNAELALLIFSTHSNASPYALREVERAVAYGRSVLALRTDQAAPTPSLEYYLDDWIDAPEGVEGKGTEIITAVRERLARTPTAATSTGRGAVPASRPPVPVRPGAGKAAAKTHPWYRRTWVIAVAAVLVAAVIGVGLGFGLTRGHASSPATATYSHIVWTQLKPSGTLPPARDGHSMAYDPTGGRLIMFGGGILGPAFLNDTWAYDPVANTWADLKPLGTVPSARSVPSLIYDQVKHRLIMFGGTGDKGALSDTWAYDPVANTWADLKPLGTVPTARSGHAVAYDQVSHRLIMFGGRADNGTLLNDTWAYDPGANTWTELRPGGTVPSARSGHSMAFDPVNHRLIMFGGTGDAGAINDTWTYDPVANTWAELKPAGALPSPRDAHSIAYDQISGRLIMFGGQDFARTGLDDAWAYDNAAHTWTKLELLGAQPSARAGQVMVYDPAGGRLIMFGGHSTSPTDLLNETWTCALSR